MTTMAFQVPRIPLSQQFLFHIHSDAWCQHETKNVTKILTCVVSPPAAVTYAVEKRTRARDPCVSDPFVRRGTDR